jgi:hypothetical protein
MLQTHKNEEVKLPLFIDDMIIYTGSLRWLHKKKKPTGLMNKFNNANI